MERSLLDTDILSGILRGRDPAVVAKAEAYLSALGKFTLSVITVAEIVDGFRRQRRDAECAKLLERLQTEGHEILPLDLESAKLAGSILGDLSSVGRPIGRADPFIAAIAIQAGIPLVTGNINHFDRIQALGYPLRLDNWR
jgi:tRNA(fMet)-specific endonuclease VapC